MTKKNLCIFGEVLYDHFPDGTRVLGGAPFNVAWHLHAFAQHPRFISRVGQDHEGDQVRAAMQSWGMDTTALQVDPQRPTGRVSVAFDDGEPHYDIVEQCAYDAIQPVAPATGCGLLYHGSLALREAQSRDSAQQLVAAAPASVFVDVNLRSPWWQRGQVLDMLRAADWVKLNDDELQLLADSDARDFVAAHDLKGLILTHGARGAEVITGSGEQYSVQPQADIRIVDTVGAGDAFASVMILGLVNEWPLETTLQRAQAFAAQVVGQRGATVADPAFYQAFIEAWQL